MSNFAQICVWRTTFARGTNSSVAVLKLFNKILRFFANVCCCTTFPQFHILSKLLTNFSQMLSLILKVSLSFKEKSNMNPMQTFNEIYFEENKLQYAVDYQ